MKGRITQVTLVVTDQDRALDFYTRQVGFEKKTDVDVPGRGRWVSVGPVGQDLELALFPAASRPDPNEWSRHWKPGANPPMVIRVDDCRATFQELSSRGVRFDQPAPVEYPWGVSATFADPDGNRLSLNQPPKAWAPPK